jgi:hypothetical protein
MVLDGESGYAPLLSQAGREIVRMEVMGDGLGADVVKAEKVLQRPPVDLAGLVTVQVADVLREDDFWTPAQGKGNVHVTAQGEERRERSGCQEGEGCIAPRPAEELGPDSGPGDDLEDRVVGMADDGTVMTEEAVAEVSRGL